jgi:CheY-like chemotaxis protein/two-component sensor histidine kinase
MRPEIVDVNEVIEEYAGMLRRMLGEEIDLETHLQPDLYPVEVDPGQLGQVLTNLTVNARDAMASGGVVTISTEKVELKKELPLAHGALSRGAYVVISVADTGEGIGAEVREHVFEPFFTTKEPGQGTGLGLATVLGIVEQSGGAISVDSESGVGTVFRIYLPRSESPARARAAEQEEAQGGAGTVLVVEDDAAVRRLVNRILLQAGYRVLVTSSAREALALANWEPSIDVLVTDVVMPEMNGHELAQRLLALRPDLRVLYISGYAPEVVRARGVQAQQEAFLQKPFTAALLTETVRGLVQADGGDSPAAEGKAPESRP